jgi:hypothetical protein
MNTLMISDIKILANFLKKIPKNIFKKYIKNILKDRSLNILLVSMPHHDSDSDLQILSSLTKSKKIA